MSLVGIIVGLIIGFFAHRFLPSYMNEKGKNLATKEDIEKITKIAETTKALVSSKLYVNQTRYIKEYELLEELSEKLVDLQLATMRLRPIMDYADQGESEEERRHKRIEAYNKAGHKFYLLKERKKPFYPESIHKQLKKFEDETWKEIVAYKHGDKSSSQYWKEAQKNAWSIEEATKKALEEVRKRIQDWEHV